MFVNIAHKTTFSGHKAAIFGLAHAKKDQHFYSTDGNGWVVEWNLQQPEQGLALAQVPSSIFAIQPLPNTDLLTLGTMQGNLYRVDITNRTATTPLIDTYPQAIFDLQIWGEYLLIACGNGYLYRRHIPTWQSLEPILVANKSLRQIALYHQLLAIASSDHQLYLYQLPDFRLLNRFEHHQSSVFSACFSSIGNYLLSGGRDAALCIWDMQKRELHHHIPAHLSTINAISYSPDGKYLATAGRDKSIKLWQSNNFKLLKVIDPSKADLPHHKHSVNRLLWVNEQHLLSGSDDKQLHLWQLEEY